MVLDAQFLVAEDFTAQAGEEFQSLLESFTVGSERDAVIAELVALGLPSSREEVRKLPKGQHVHILNAALFFIEFKRSVKIAALGLPGSDTTVEEIILSGADISNKFVDVAQDIFASNLIAVDVIIISQGIHLEQGVTYNVVNDGGGNLRRIDWSGTAVDGVLASSDKLRIVYPGV